MAKENTNTAVATVNKENEVTQQLLMDYLKQTNSNLMPNEQAQFMAIAKAFNLNPWKREVYAIAYGQGNGRKLSIIVGYEVYLRRAEEFPQYDGFETEFNGEGPNMCCTCKVYRKDRTRPTGATVFLKEYSQNNSMWNTKTHVMLEKVAIATAMRRAFPSEFNGMPYIADELPDNMTMSKEEMYATNRKMLSEAKKDIVKDIVKDSDAEDAEIVEEAIDAVTELPESVQEEPVKKPSIRNYTSKQFAAVLVTMKESNEGAYNEVAKKMHAEGWTTAKDVPCDRYDDVRDWFDQANEDVPF